MSEITDNQWYAIDLLNEYYQIGFKGKTKRDAIEFIKLHKEKYEQAKNNKQRDRNQEYNDWSCDDHDTWC